MSPATAITIDKLGKRYKIGKLTQKSDTLRDAIAAPWKSGWEFITRKKASYTPDLRENPYIWALKDISVDIHQGEVVGIIGRNGAGKTTLLKVLAQITEPSTGRARVTGRVGSLLEVGTGFHPELTGRENIFLNGAILGMKRAEVVQKFDEMVAFAEIEQFLDTPVKRYSSGMYVRLAFAVAAHLEPEILFVDEVLSVGDAGFQKKCLGKMDDISQQGRTILFVSHNLNAVQRLCTRGILLKQGCLDFEGDISTAINRYLSLSTETALPGHAINLSQLERSGTGGCRFTSASFWSDHNASGNHPVPDGSLKVDITVDSNQARTVSSMAFTCYDPYGTKLINADTLALGVPVNLNAGMNTFSFELEKLHLNPGLYTVGLWLANASGEVIDHVNPAFRLEVVDISQAGLGGRPRADGAVPCSFTFHTLN